MCSFTVATSYDMNILPVQDMKRWHLMSMQTIKLVLFTLGITILWN